MPKTKIKTNPLDHQALMDLAYDRWSKGDLQNKSRTDFIDALDPQQRAAVLAGNLNYQWQNGGLAQWHDNQYSVCYSQVQALLRRMAKDFPIATEVLALLDKGMEILEDERYNDPEYDGFLDSKLDASDAGYYRIDKKFMRDFQKYLNKGGY